MTHPTPQASELPTAPRQFGPELDYRIRLTSGCDDCRDIPKVSRAGETVEVDGTRAQVMHNGVLVLEDGYYGAWMTELIRRLRGHHEPQEERAFHEVLRHVRPGGAMVELGAYWGYYSLWFAQAVPGARCVLVEPDPRNLATGRANFALNGREGTFVHASVGRTSVPPRPFRGESGDSPSVPEVCVDELISAAGLPRVELLLADIQGAELAMLEGAVRSIERGLIRFVFVSTHHYLASGDPLTHQRCLRFIRDHGGHVLLEHDVAESFSADGLIVASFDPADRLLPPISVSHCRASASLYPTAEYALADAWGAIAAVEASVRSAAARDAELAAALNNLRDQNGVLGQRWAAFAPPVERPAARPEQDRRPEPPEAARGLRSWLAERWKVTFGVKPSLK